MTPDESAKALTRAAELYPSLRKRATNPAFNDIWHHHLKAYAYEDAIEGIKHYYIRNTHKVYPNIDNFSQAIDEYVSEIKPANKRCSKGQKTLEDCVVEAPTSRDQRIGRAYLDMINDMLAKRRGLDTLWIAQRCEQNMLIFPQDAAYWMGEERRWQPDDMEVF